jgi:hypothetical protein
MAKAVEIKNPVYLKMTSMAMQIPAVTQASAVLCFSLDIEIRSAPLQQIKVIRQSRSTRGGLPKRRR